MTAIEELQLKHLRESEAISLRMKNRTPEQIKASYEKGLKTRRRNKQERGDKIKKIEEEALNLKFGIHRLKREMDLLVSHKLLSDSKIKKIGVDRLLTEYEISNKSMVYEKICGVYFLILSGKVQYVGQSVDIHSRIATQSREKSFTHFSVIPCERNLLDKIESLYIHVLRPPLNGGTESGSKWVMAPLSLEKLINMGLM